VKKFQTYVLFFLALLFLPLTLFFIPAMLIARYGRSRHGVRIGLAVSNRWPAFLQYCRFPYDIAIVRAGAKVVTIKPSDMARLDSLLEEIDGVILSGGEDIDPELYDGAGKSAYNVNTVRDELEIRLLKKAEKMQMPILCVCRGAQLLAVAHGGKLKSHDSDRKLLKTHSSTIFRFAGHYVNIASQTILHSIFKRDKIMVNSIHHQNIANPGSLVVSGRSSDDIVEAVEVPEADFVLGVQWHPELRALFDYRNEKIFKSMVDSAVKYSVSRKLESR
jgi:putative glutamine amidotransferase